MPRNKDLKRLVRARMKKTGESYTAARSQIVRKAPKRTVSRHTADSAPPSSKLSAPRAEDHAALAGMSDAVVVGKTGRAWEQWVRALDADGARQMSHREIATLLHEKYRMAGWWAQMVTVGYERIAGLRERGQRRDGSYEANKSRTFAVPVGTLFDAWADATIRRQWLKDAGVKVRTATAPTSMRLGYSDGTIVAVGFMDKGKSKSVVAVQHTKLPDRGTALRRKQYWSERLEALGEVLAER